MLTLQSFIVEKYISSSVGSAHHPNTGQNIQQTIQLLYIILTVFIYHVTNIQKYLAHLSNRDLDRKFSIFVASRNYVTHLKSSMYTQLKLKKFKFWIVFKSKFKYTRTYGRDSPWFCYSILVFWGHFLIKNFLNWTKLC